jgi:hypothetical protein
MSHLSLARIMYGSEDSRTSGWMNASAASSRFTSSTIPDYTRMHVVPEQDTLGELLHKAWLYLSTKH